MPASPSHRTGVLAIVLASYLMIGWYIPRLDVDFRAKNMRREDTMGYRQSPRLMRNVVRALALALTMGGPTLASAQTALKVMVFPGLANYSIFAAQHKGFFAKHGLSIELINTPNSELQRERLAKGEIQIAETAADNAVAMVELANKVLKNAGLNKGDYKVNPVGGTPQRLEAMTKDKANAAGVLNVPFSFRAAQAGLKDMGSAAAAIGAYQAVGAVVLRSWAQANSDSLVHYIRAIVEGGRWVRDPANKAEATQLLADRLQLPLDVAAKSYALATDPADGMAKDANFDAEGFRNVLRLRAEIEGQWGGTPPPIERYFDLTYYDKALAGLR